jgi:hypothetical protein
LTDKHKRRGGVEKGIVRVAERKISKSPPAVDHARQTQTRNPSSEIDIGNALRAAYESAVNEEIPPEMLDLLSKLR